MKAKKINRQNVVPAGPPPPPPPTHTCVVLLAIGIGGVVRDWEVEYQDGGVKSVTKSQVKTT